MHKYKYYYPVEKSRLFGGKNIQKKYCTTFLFDLHYKHLPSCLIRLQKNIRKQFSRPLSRRISKIDCAVFSDI